MPKTLVRESERGPLLLGVLTAAMSTPLLAYMLYMVMEGEETLSTSLRTVVIVYMVFLVFAVNYPLQRIKRL